MSPDGLALLDTGLRGAAIALFLLIGFATLRKGRGRPAAWLGALLSLGGAAYAICSAPDHASHRSLWFAPVFVLCTGNVVVFWLFTRAVFDDRFRPAPWHAVLWLGFVVWPVAWLFGADFVARDPLQVAMRLAALVLAFAVLAQTITDWRGDLVEGRRRLRVFIVVAVLLHIAITASVDLSLGPERVPPWLHAVNAAALTTIAAVIASVLLHANLDAVIAAPVVAAKASQTGVDEEAPDPALVSRLERLMTVDRIYRQEGLTIGALAGRLELSERRLRQAINRGLGYRNFSDYLNRHRLADVRQALADPAQAAVPILTIALDAGFQSLGPFNRAFKAETGMTPTEFRRASVKTEAAGPPNPESASR
jgi:AraC-like DNA-binding protein